MWPDVKTKSSPIFSKCCQNSILLKLWCLQNSPKGHRIFWPLLVWKFVTLNFKNLPIWSHWVQRKMFCTIVIFFVKIPGGMASPATAASSITLTSGTKICGRIFNTVSALVPVISICSKSQNYKFIRRFWVNGLISKVINTYSTAPTLCILPVVVRVHLPSSLMSQVLVDI